MASTARQHYSPSHAGNILLKECASMRARLRANLHKPTDGDEDSLAAYIEAKVAIRNMDHKELRAAVLDANITAYYTDRANSCHAAKAP